MRFVPAYFQLQPPSEETTAYYTQKVQSETTVKGIMQNQEITRSLRVQITPSESLSLLVEISTLEEKLALESVLKKQENISSAIAKTFNVVQLRLNTLGEIINIVNHDELIQKWHPIRKKLEREFKGDAVTRHLNGIEKKLKNQDALLNDFKQYRLFGGIFNQLYFEHSSVDSKINQRSRKIDNFIFGRPGIFRERIFLEKIDEENPNISLQIHGEFDLKNSDFRTIKEEFKKRKYHEGAELRLENYSGLYTIDKESGIINIMDFQIDASFGDEFKKSIHYNLTQNLK